MLQCHPAVLSNDLFRAPECVERKWNAVPFRENRKASSVPFNNGDERFRKTLQFASVLSHRGKVEQWR